MKHCDSPKDHYIHRFDMALRSGLRHWHEPDIDDVTQSETAALLDRFDYITSRYTVPEVYARIRVRPAMENHRRREGAQRGQGSYYIEDSDGLLRRGRRVVSGDAPAGGDSPGTVFETMTARHPDQSDLVAEEIDRQRMLDAALLDTDSATRELLWLGYGMGFTDGELAVHFDVARETVNRWKRRAVRRVQGRLSPDDV